MLPKIACPEHTITLPASKQKIKFRPYLIKEEKILLMAYESNDEAEYLNAIKQIVNNCVLTKTKVEDWPLIDIEYFFLNLRARSVGEIAAPAFRCTNVVNEAPCDNLMKLSVDITKIEPTGIKTGNDLRIFFNKLMGVQMRYPSLNMTRKSANDKFDELLSVVISCIEFIFDGENIYYTKDCTTEELVDFIESLSKAQFAKIEEFLNELPVLKYEEKLKCSKCNFEHTIALEGYADFFV